MPQGFETTEFKARLTRAQSRMNAADLDAILLTTEPDIRYFTGYLTRFWESPCRPWFLVLPRSGDPIAVIPSIGAALMARTWITDIRTWRAPDLEDDGISLLAETLRNIGPRIGTPSGLQSHLRMPLGDFARLNAALPQPIGADADILRSLRLVKSEAEIEKIKTACQIATRAFERVPEIARIGQPLAPVFRDFQRLCLDEGADWVPYLAGAAAPGGYGDVISPADDRPLEAGDVLMLDTGLVHDGYFCDFDRNFSVGSPSPDVAAGHSRLIEATYAAFEAARPGATAAELFHVMDKIVTGGAGGSEAGRYGHGLGMNLTEWPSLIPTDHTPLVEGMVLTLEPGIELAPGRALVHEENIVIRENGAEWLSQPYGAEMIRI
ncbi:Xaa-Pro peptidase family protein [Planktomarina temperata]|jgi:Xaa-Pro aminopeptidase|uniref:M24 family metallopeptidase n=2 Tax=Planktomarina TaxID=1284657 RepID=UPI002320675F|nr:aminopeptidase P family protein [Planktomarina temperata]MDA7481985.1 Xaa-Pro peptidase family protein [Planktomarina temperata]MDA9995671.1 Xaa-Pro peptidase family protein [Planktomarina temperata]MDB2453998.1 Xaa-Pro peptidase family protein [Planktomarina temperata]MDB2465132.1 Xaa-Pro peptidase family protein [Planktomarina temperata]